VGLPSPISPFSKSSGAFTIALVIVEAHIFLTWENTMDECLAGAQKWIDRGATHYSFSAMGLGLSDVNDHLKLTNDFKERMQAL
jgi:hypothetical protein